jgi:hypothetical protein
MKSMNGIKIDKLNSQLTKLNSERINIEELLEAGINNLLKLDYAYENGDLDKKCEMIAASCLDKMYIENGHLELFG